MSSAVMLPGLDQTPPPDTGGEVAVPEDGNFAPVLGMDHLLERNGDVVGEELENVSAGHRFGRG